MRVQACLQFSCALSGRNLETELITETRNLVMFRQGKVSMRCAFCGLNHHWRLMRYQRPITSVKRSDPQAALAVRQP
jgi:uncharacterized beta-barrel protein YwiB (DUF1934 family)